MYVEDHHHHHRETLPRGALIGACALVVLSLGAAFGSRFLGTAPSLTNERSALTVRDLQFRDRPDGAVLVFVGAEPTASAVLEPGTNGFVRGVLRGLVRERRARGMSSEAPFRLTRWADGHVSLEDTATTRVVELRAFGPTNQEAFARLLAPHGTALAGGN